MPRKPKTWSDKMKAAPPHTVLLKDAFAGVPAGARLLISSPPEVDAFIRQLPVGRVLPIQQLRRELAAQHGADAACPVSTAIFLRTVAELAWQQIEEGTPVADVTPFWRVVDPASPLARKLACGAEWIEQQRAAESKGGAPAGTAAG